MGICVSLFPAQLLCIPSIVSSGGLSLNWDDIQNPTAAINIFLRILTDLKEA